MDIIEKIQLLIDNKAVTKVHLAKLLGISRQTLDNYINKVTAPTMDEAEEMSKILDNKRSKTKDLYNYMHVNDSENDSSTNNSSERIPFYDAIAVGGIKMLADQTPVEMPTQLIDPGSFLRRATGSIRIYGHSMFPKYPAGCIVAYKDADKDVIIWGEDYVIELEDRRIIKRLEKCDIINCVKAVSYNKSEEYEYAAIEIPKKKIKRLYMVLGKIELEASV